MIRTFKHIMKLPVFRLQYGITYGNDNILCFDIILHLPSLLPVSVPVSPPAEHADKHSIAAGMTVKRLFRTDDLFIDCPFTLPVPQIRKS